MIDYIGNHRSFLVKPRTLFQLEGGDVGILRALNMLDSSNAAELLPPNCSVTYDLEAKNILRELIGADRQNVGDRLRLYYEEFKSRTDFRPFATEAFHDGYDPASARPGYGSWFHFVRTIGDLTGTDDDAEVKLRPFLSSLESTPMTKSFKMVVLLAMIADEAFPGTITIERLMERVRTIARRTAALRTEFGEALDDDRALKKLLEENPIDAWTGGRGTRGEQYFRYDGSRFSSAISLPPSLRESGAELVRELAEWRLARYLRRAGATGAPRIVCKVSHTNGKPILFLPSRDRNPGIPEGWVEVTADGETYQAKFVKIAVNVMTRGSSDENVLPNLMRKWFGPNAGLPGTTFQVVFEQSPDGYILSPLDERHERRLTLWERYPRAEVPKFFGFELSGFEAQSGVVTRPGLILLFVTLDKTGMQEEHRYEDAFLSPTEFRWQSQNRTTRDSKMGRMIQNHRAEGTAVHLFVRASAKVGGKTQPFIYCGELEFERCEGDKPITVWWQLRVPVPSSTQTTLRITV